MLAVGKIIPKSLQVGFANYMYLLLVCFDFVSDVSNIQAVSLDLQKKCVELCEPLEMMKH